MKKGSILILKKSVDFHLIPEEYCFLDIEFSAVNTFLLKLESCCATGSHNLWWEISWYLSCFPLMDEYHYLIPFCFWDFCFVFSFQKFDFVVPWPRFLWVYAVWSFLSFLNVYVFVKIEKFLSIFSLNDFSVPCSLSPCRIQ